MKGIGLIAGLAGAVAGYMARRHMERIERLEDQIIMMESADTGDAWPIDEEDVTRKYPPQAVWICDHCESLLLFHDSKENMQKHIDEVKDCDILFCPACGEGNDIDPVTRHIMNQTEGMEQ